MGPAHTPLPASFSRFLSDAERWAAEGDRDRSQRVLALAADLATPARVPAVLLAWHATGDVPAPRAAAPTTALPAAPVVIAELDPAGLPIPGFPTAPPTVDLDAPRGMAPTPLPVPADLPPPPTQHAAPEPLPPLELRSGGLLKAIVVMALVAGAVWMYLPAGMKASIPTSIPGIALPARGGSVADAEDALRAGDPARALEIARTLPAEGEDAPRGHLLRGRALLATGDTAGAIDALAAAARCDNRGTVAWAAAEALARLPGREAPAAEAYLLAFAAGLPEASAEKVARAQELAGRPDRARRVREQTTPE
ncbi:MAG TPA: hypothetical protein VGB92_11515 [Longimicrobium sp.]